MNHRNATRFCESLDGDVNRRWFGPRVRQAGGARLPTKEEYEALRIVLGYPNHYNGNRLPDLVGRWFWSSSLSANYYAWVFNGSSGGVDSGAYRYYDNGSVRCVGPGLL